MTTAHDTRSLDRFRRTALVLVCALTTVGALAQEAPGGAFELFGTQHWQLVFLDVDGVTHPVDEDAVFALNENGRLAGSLGCNQLIASSQISDDDEAAFGPVTSTLMACPEPLMSAERAFVTGLEAVDTYVREGGSVTLTGPAVTIVLEAVGAAGGEDDQGVGRDVAAWQAASAAGMEAFNAAVAAAAEAGVDWVTDPLRVALAFVDLSSAPTLSIDMAVRDPEQASDATVVIEERGLLDDSLEGVVQTLHLERALDHWVVAAHEVTYLCRRGPEPEVVAPAVCL